MLINTRELYQKNIDALKQELSVANAMALPKISKVSVNIGLGMHRGNKEMVSYIEKSLATITGQQAVKTHAKKAIAGFKIRTGDLVGMRVTLRGKRMDDFLNRLINITLPRIRDFRGIDTANFDKQGNLTLGFKDQVPFAEMGHEVLDKPFGLSVAITIKNSNAEKSAALLRALGFPLKNK